MRRVLSLLALIAHNLKMPNRRSWRRRSEIQAENRRLYQRHRCQTEKYRANERLRYNASTIPNGRQPHLYILKYEAQHAGCYKIGRTGAYDKRLKDLNSGHLSKLAYVAQYDGLGHLELLVHDELSPYRVVGCPSREWFFTSVEHIDRVIQSLMVQM